MTSFESQAKELQASAMLHLSGTVHGHTLWVHELLQQKIFYYIHAYFIKYKQPNHTNA